MKRGLLGAALLAVLFFSGLLSTRSLNVRYTPMEESLRQTARAAAEENWPQARESLRRAHQQWQQCRPGSCVFTEHCALEQIDVLLARLETWSRAEDPSPCADLCAQLIRELQKLSDANALNWENLL